MQQAKSQLSFTYRQRSKTVTEKGEKYTYAKKNINVPYQ